MNSGESLFNRGSINIMSRADTATFNTFLLVLVSITTSRVLFLTFHTFYFYFLDFFFTSLLIRYYITNCSVILVFLLLRIRFRRKHFTVLLYLDLFRRMCVCAFARACMRVFNCKFVNQLVYFYHSF